MRDYITSLVQQSLDEYIKEASLKPHILIMLTNARVNSNEMSNHINELSKQFTISLIISESEQKHVNTSHVYRTFILEEVNAADIQFIIETANLIYCPSISHGYLASLSMLLDETNSVWITLQMLLNGKEVLLGNDVIKQKEGAGFWRSPSLDKKVQNYMKELKQDGVHFCSMNQAAKVIVKQMETHQNKKTLLLAKHIEEMANNGSQTITVPKNSIITPMARDIAKQLHVNIKRENNSEKRDAL